MTEGLAAFAMANLKGDIRVLTLQELAPYVVTMDTINEMNYTPNALARKLSTGNTLNIGFLIPDIENPFFSHLLRGLTNAAEQYGYNIFLYGTDDSVEKEHRFFSSVKAERLSGIIVIPVDANNLETCKRLLDFEKAHGYPGYCPRYQ